MRSCAGHRDGADDGPGGRGEKRGSLAEMMALMPDERDIAGRNHAGELAEHQTLRIGGAPGALRKHTYSQPHCGQGLYGRELAATVDDAGLEMVFAAKALDL